MPVLALGGEAAAGARAKVIMRFAADNVEGVVVPDSGHWLMEENPAVTPQIVAKFLCELGDQSETFGHSYPFGYYWQRGRYDISANFVLICTRSKWQ